MSAAPIASASFDEGTLHLELVANDGTLLSLRCPGNLSLPDFSPDREPLARFLGPEVYGRRIVLDLGLTNYLDTSGISWLVHCHECCEQAGGRLVLCSITPQPAMLLKLLHMDRVLHTAPSADAARSLALREKG
jgi:anti-sigma B factor antagonist